MSAILPDVTDDVYERALRAYFDDQTSSLGYLQILLERDMYEHRFRAALAVAVAAGVESVPMRYGVRNPVGGSPVYTHPGMSKAGVLQMHAADPSFHEPVCRRQTEWEAIAAEDQA